MSTVILVVALGAIFSIVVVLLFRRIVVLTRHTAEVDETVRQLTETDVELYRELLRLRRHMAGGGPTADRETTTRTAAVAGGNTTGPPPIHGQQPVRRKRHLALYILSGAALALSALAREACRAYRGRVASALVGATVTASTVTVLTLTPWQGDIIQPPSSAPTKEADSTIHAPKAGPTPSPGTRQPSRTLQSSAPAPDESQTQSQPLPSDASWPAELIPIGDVSSPTALPALPGSGITQSGIPGVTATPTDAAATPSPSPSSTPAGAGVCASASGAPAGSTDVCLPLLGGG